MWTGATPESPSARFEDLMHQPTGAPTRADHPATPSLLDRARVTATPPANARYKAVLFGGADVPPAVVVEQVYELLRDTTPDEPIPHTLTEAAEQLPRVESMSPADRATFKAASHVRIAAPASSAVAS
jgi:hypothetical protein